MSLQKLLVRVKAGCTRTVYLVSMMSTEVVMYELMCANPKDSKNWMEKIREAIENCPAEEMDEEESKRLKIQALLHDMREKDKTMAKMCHDKMRIYSDLMVRIGGNTPFTLGNSYVRENG